MPLIRKNGRLVGAALRSVKLDFEEMPDEGIDALRMLRGGEYVGVLWFGPFSWSAEVLVEGQRVLLEDYHDADSLVREVCSLLDPAPATSNT